MAVEKVRKQRNDKKWSVQPFVSYELCTCINRLAFITDMPIKDVMEAICKSGSNNPKVIENLSVNFICDIRINNIIYIGSANLVPVKKRISPGLTRRMSTRVTGDLHSKLKLLAYALNCSIARACALLLDATIRDTDFINEFVEEYLTNNVDAERMKELKEVLNYIKVNNPYDEEVSWSALLNHLVEEVRSGAEKVQNTVSSFVINHWKK